MTPRALPLPALLLRALLALATLAITVAPLSGCDSLDQLDNFDVPITGEVTIQGETLVGSILGNFPTLDQFNKLDLSQTSTFQNKDYSPDDVDSVILESMVFRVLDPEGQDLAFLGEVVFYVETEGLPRKEIARQSRFPEGETVVSFETNKDDLKNYLLAKEASITTEVSDSKSPPQDTRIEVEAIFDVDVNVF